jgi:hypothetical protein
VIARVGEAIDFHAGSTGLTPKQALNLFLVIDPEKRPNPPRPARAKHEMDWPARVQGTRELSAAGTQASAVLQSRRMLGVFE